MKSKKFVLAGLVLAAITMVLLPLSGCKNDSVPETPAAKLVSISVTPSTRTVYSVGEEVAGEIEVTATYDDGEERTVTGTITTDTSTLTQSAGIGKPVTVSYKEGDTTKEDTFTVDVVNVEEPTKLTSYSSPNNTGNDCTYIAFGEWPQTEAVDFKPTTDSQSHGIFVDTYYVEGNDKYVEEDGKYYKVEPIVWRVLTTNYEVPEGGTAGNALLLAEKILTGGIPYYVSLSSRTIGGQTVYANSWQYSTIRAWLNGSYEEKDTQATTYTGKGFLQTAFTESAQDLIADTTVDNSATSTFGTGENTQENPYTCDKSKDKIFLLSQQEATNSEYGFDAYNNADSARIRVTTDYAKATGAQSSTEDWWWLRSPSWNLKYYVCYINDVGHANNYRNVISTYGGVVPALSISLQ